MSFLDSTADPKIARRRPLLAFVLVTLVVGAAGSIFAQANIPTWYAGLVHPAITPPDWVYPPVWTTLYVLMAVAAWRVWTTHRPVSPRARRALEGEMPVATSRGCVGKRGVSKEMAAYALQLTLNFGWSVIFFGLHQIGVAMIEIVFLALTVLVTTILFGRRDRIAGLLFLPTLAWVCFAAALNHAFWTLNT